MLNILYGLIGYIVTFSILNLASTHPVQATTPSTLFVIEHSNEFIVLLCVITLFLGTWLGVKLPNENERLDYGTKFVSGIFGGLVAFIYCLHRDKGLTLLNPIWVGVTAICLPATIMVIVSKVKDFVEKYEVK